MNPVRYVQRSRQHSYREAGVLEGETVKYCGRPGNWANWFEVGATHWTGVTPKTVEETVEFYEEHIKDVISDGFLELRELTRHDYLSCWCREDEPCHTQLVLIPKVNELLNKEME